LCKPQNNLLYLNIKILYIKYLNILVWALAISVFYILHPNKITNENLWDKTKQIQVEIDIKKRKWGWIGHTLRKPPENTTKQSLN
jgi:hypothetical protein